jgi:hypothetical protein
MKAFLFVLSGLIWFVSTECIAQEISIYSESAQEIYRIDSEKLSKKKVKEILSNNSETLQQFKNGQAWNIAGAAVCGAGGAVLVAAVGVAIDNSINKEILSGGEKDESSVNWALLGAGIGTMIPGAIMLIHGRQLRLKAVRKYNESFGTTGIKREFYLEPASQGIGLTLHF